MGRCNLGSCVCSERPSLGQNTDCTGWKGNKCHPFNSRRGRLKGPIYIQSTAVEQVVACALVTQRARVRSPVGTGFLGEVFFGVFPHL